MNKYREGSEPVIVEAVEKFLKEVSSTPSDISNGLKPRPRPGDKKRAQESYVLLLRQIHELRLTVDRCKDVKLIPSTSE